MKFPMAVLLLATVSVFALAGIAQADPVTGIVKGTISAAGSVLSTAGKAIKITVDAAGNVIDTTGTAVKVSADTVGYIVDPVTGLVKGTVNTSGRILDPAGKIIVTPAYSGYLVIDPRTTVVRGTISTTGEFVRISTAPAVRTAPTAYVIDPMTGAVRGTVNLVGDMRDLAGLLVTDDAYRGHVVINPVTHVATGMIDGGGHMIGINMGSVGGIFRPAPGKISAYVIDSHTGMVKGTLDVYGNLFDAAGNRMLLSTADGFILIDPVSQGFKGAVEASTGRIVVMQFAPASLQTTTLVSTELTPVAPTVATLTEVVSPATVIPTKAGWIVVDPITGKVRGTLDASGRLTSGVAPLPMGDLVVDSTTGIVRGVVMDSSGRIMDVTVAPVSTTFVTAIDARISELDRAITDSLSSGTITSAQAATLKAELNRIAAAQAAARLSGNVYIYTEALPIAKELKVLGGRVVTVAHIKPVTPVVGSHFATVDGKVVMVDDIYARRFEVERRISNEFAAGRLSSRQVGILKANLDRIASLEASYRRDGRLSYKESRELYRSFDRVATVLDRYVASR